MDTFLDASDRHLYFPEGNVINSNSVAILCNSKA